MYNLYFHQLMLFFKHYQTKEWMAGNVKLGAIIVDETDVQDIDNQTDWKLAEMKYKIFI